MASRETPDLLHQNTVQQLHTALAHKHIRERETESRMGTKGTALTAIYRLKKGRGASHSPPSPFDVDPSMHHTHSGSKSWVRVDTCSAKVSCRLDVNSPHEEKNTTASVNTRFVFGGGALTGILLSNFHIYFSNVIAQHGEGGGAQGKWRKPRQTELVLRHRTLRKTHIHISTQNHTDKRVKKK